VEALQIVIKNKEYGENFTQTVNRLIESCSGSAEARNSALDKSIVKKLVQSLDKAVNEIIIPTTSEEDLRIMEIMK